MSLQLVVLEDEVVRKEYSTEAAVDPTVGLELVPVERVGVSVELRVVAKRLVAKDARPAALPTETVPLPVGSLLRHFTLKTLY